MGYLRLDKHQINKLNNKIMFNIFICEALASRALGKPNAFSLNSIVRFAVSCIQLSDWVAAFNAYRHISGLGIYLGARLVVYWNVRNHGLTRLYSYRKQKALIAREKYCFSTRPRQMS